MAQLSCTLEEFYNIIGPKIRNDVAALTKQKKNNLGLVCQHCGKKVEELDAAHKHDSTRRDIIKLVLDDYESEGKYLIPNLQKVLDKIKDQHKSNEVFFFLCKECHKKYDDSNKIENFKVNTSNKITANANDLKQVILTIFRESPKKYFTPRMMYDIIQKRNPKYYADTLWGLRQKGFLTSPQRGYYQWNGEEK